MVTTGEPVTRAQVKRPPPPRLCLGIGFACLAANHLGVALGDGVRADALVLGCFLVLLGAWGLIPGEAFAAAWEWSNRPGWRTVVSALIGVAAAAAAAEGVAWFGYGQHLVG